AVAVAIDNQQLWAYWHIGRQIVQVDQQGLARATYGASVLETLSTQLMAEFGKGFSVTNLRYMRQFYLTYQDRIHHKACDESVLIREGFKTSLSWSHFRTLMKETRSEVRDFYEIESAANNWSVPELSRQMGSLLFERLAKSKDKVGVLALSKKGQVIQTPQDVLKDPLVLEFLEMPEAYQWRETELEQALISHLQSFLLELGKGFAFIARQKRITLDGEHFWPDLVFYHTILKCYVIIDLKTGQLKHGDLGQMQMYVHYFDRKVKAEDDNPTMGLVLCAKKNNAVVKYTLDENNKQIFASKYQFHLPTEQELVAELTKEVKEFEHQLTVDRHLEKKD
ncbi:MAG: PDDEXK nuclease domain-containing protein, partial [Gammaproteobacteria bacterium]|nr:PDDEXK nuclease domain-containing protein [Gammaproteobacteria bacterium]